MGMVKAEWPVVRGIIDGTVYEVRMVAGGWQDNRLVEHLFSQFKGRDVEVPGHGVFRVDNTAAGLVALLLAETRVVRMVGDPPTEFTRVTAGG